MQVAQSQERSSEIPVIGITTGKTKNLDRPHDAPSFGQVETYITAVRQAGAAPVLLPYWSETAAFAEEQAGLAAALARVDGLILAGGNDVDPRQYGELPRATTEITSRHRDETEAFYIACAEQRRLPLFAICRGLQIWNIKNGGTLHQHLPEDMPESAGGVRHLNLQGERQRTHPVTVERLSRYGDLLLRCVSSSGVVNSLHHQGIRKLGRDLQVAAWAGDGLIEAVESTVSDWFALGVQWHPEAMPGHLPLFQALIAAAALRRPGALMPRQEAA